MKAEDRTRTYDILITNQLFYQLNYFGIIISFANNDTDEDLHLIDWTRLIQLVKNFHDIYRAICSNCKTMLYRVYSNQFAYYAFTITCKQVLPDIVRGYKPVYSATISLFERCTQDSNLQAFYSQRFSRPLPQPPGHAAYFFIDTHIIKMWVSLCFLL